MSSEILKYCLASLLNQDVSLKSQELEHLQDNIESSYLFECIQSLEASQELSKTQGLQYKVLENFEITAQEGGGGYDQPEL